jgi:hypothetical protein
MGALMIDTTIDLLLICFAISHADPIASLVVENTLHITQYYESYVITYEPVQEDAWDEGVITVYSWDDVVFETCRLAWFEP